jgi:hypothetical protein
MSVVVAVIALARVGWSSMMHLSLQPGTSYVKAIYRGRWVLNPEHRPRSLYEGGPPGPGPSPAPSHLNAVG